MNRKIRNRILTILFILINVIVVYFIAKKTFNSSVDSGFANVFNTWLSNYWYLIAVILLPIIALLVEGTKYYLMIYHITGEKRFALGFKTAALGKYYDNITPFGSGGQASQIYYLYKNDISGGEAASLPVSAFSMMQVAFFFIVVLVFIFSGNLIPTPAFKIAAYVGSVFMIFIPLVVIAFSLLPKLTGKIILSILILLKKIGIVKNPRQKMMKIAKFLTDFKENLSYLAKSKRLIFFTFILSIIYQSALFSIPFFVVKASGGQGNFFELYSMCAFVYSAIAFIPTPGNSGGAEISFTIVFVTLTGPFLFWGMILWRFSSYFFVIIIGLMVLLYDSLFKKKKQILIE